MSRFLVFFIVCLLFALGLVLCLHLQHSYIFTAAMGLLILLGLHDHFVSSKNILRLYPITGHLRYIFESIRPEIQQYFVESNSNGHPYEREMRSLVYRRAKNTIDTHPFGTERNIRDPHFTFAQHSLNVVKPSKEAIHVVFGNEQCQQPYKASVINISAMSYGALSAKAIRTLNRGAKLAGMAHNTGEGGLSSHHLKEGGDLIWQLGTAYFGTRDKEGYFDPDTFKEKSQLDAVKMIEVKLSQGAKPSHGGVLPAAKISKEIAEIRGIEQGKDCISPPTHTAFSTPIEMMHFIQQLREFALATDNNSCQSVKRCLKQTFFLILLLLMARKAAQALLLSNTLIILACRLMKQWLLCITLSSVQTLDNTLKLLAVQKSFQVLTSFDE